MNFNNVIVNMANLSFGGYTSYACCVWQCFYTVWTGGVTFGVNMIITVEVYRLLSATKRLQMYQPPAKPIVLRRCLGVVLVVTALAALVFIPGVPFKPRLMRGIMCLPASDGTFNGRSELFVYFVLPCVVGVPTVVTLTIGAVSWYRRLLVFEIDRQEMTLSEKESSQALHNRAAHRERVQAARSLTIYFSRVFFCLLMWYPAFLSLLIAIEPVAPFAIGMLLISWQSFVSSMLALTKADVRQAALHRFRLCIPGARSQSQVAPSAAIPSDPGKQLAMFTTK
mmetsp:Transcript_13362/g.40508  ORF Transcript_13362/g.40508 Transcript_13362/m.40508 type:complete len:282 (-) Transcript_13362:151-996(-)